MNVRDMQVDIEKLLIGIGTSISDKSHAENEKKKKFADDSVDSPNTRKLYLLNLLCVFCIVLDLEFSLFFYIFGTKNNKKLMSYRSVFTQFISDFAFLKSWVK